jgi:hypothetical protein
MKLCNNLTYITVDRVTALSNVIYAVVVVAVVFNLCLNNEIRGDTMSFYKKTDIDNEPGESGQRLPKFFCDDNSSETTYGGINISRGGVDDTYVEISDSITHNNSSKSLKFYIGNKEGSGALTGICAGSDNAGKPGDEFWSAGWFYIPSGQNLNMSGGAGRKFFGMQATGRTWSYAKRPLCQEFTLQEDGAFFYATGRLDETIGSFGYYRSGPSKYKMNGNENEYRVPFDKWFQLQLYLKVESDNTGITRWFKDGVLLWERTGIRTYEDNSGINTDYFGNKPPSALVYRYGGNNQSDWVFYADDLVITNDSSRATSTDGKGNSILPLEIESSPTPTGPAQDDTEPAPTNDAIAEMSNLKDVNLSNIQENDILVNIGGTWVNLPSSTINDKINAVIINEVDKAIAAHNDGIEQLVENMVAEFIETKTDVLLSGKIKVNN